MENKLTAFYIEPFSFFTKKKEILKKNKKYHQQKSKIEKEQNFGDSLIFVIHEDGFDFLRLNFFIFIIYV